MSKGIPLLNRRKRGVFEIYEVFRPDDFERVGMGVCESLQ